MSYAPKRGVTPTSVCPAAGRGPSDERGLSCDWYTRRTRRCRDNQEHERSRTSCCREKAATAGGRRTKEKARDGEEDKWWVLREDEVEVR